MEILNKIVDFLYRNSPLVATRLLSFMLVVLALVDHLTNPFEHIISETNLLYEFLIRVGFLFCGIFGLLGNGRTFRIRALIVSLPYLYLAALYILKYVETGVHALVVPLVLTLIPGLWLVLLGALYEQRIISFYSSIVNSYDPKSDN